MDSFPDRNLAGLMEKNYRGYHHLLEGGSAEEKNRAASFFQRSPDLTFWKNISFDLDVTDKVFAEHHTQLRGAAGVVRFMVHALNLMFADDMVISKQHLAKTLHAQNKSRIKVLAGHGSFQDLQWAYADQKKFFPVYGWINAQDPQRYGALVLLVCNPAHVALSDVRIPVYYANDTISQAPAYAPRFAPASRTLDGNR